MLHPAWCSSGFGVQVSSSVTVTHLLWSDNFYVVAKSIGEWQIMFTQLTHLLESHGLHRNEQFVIVLEGGYCKYEERSWTLPEFPDLLIHKKTTMESIGTIIQQDGADTKSKVLLSKHLSWKVRFKRLTSFVLPVMMHAVSTWTWTKTLLDFLNVFENKMLRTIVGCKRLPDDTFLHFLQRHSRLARKQFWKLGNINLSEKILRAIFRLGVKLCRKATNVRSHFLASATARLVP